MATPTEKHSAQSTLFCCGCWQFVGLLLAVEPDRWRCESCAAKDTPRATT